MSVSAGSSNFVPPRRRPTKPVTPDGNWIESQNVDDDIELEQVSRNGEVIFVKPQDVQIDGVSSI